MANTNEIFITGFSNGLEGTVELDFSFIRLVRTNDSDARAKYVFEYLMLRQRAQAAKGGGPEGDAGTAPVGLRHAGTSGACLALLSCVL